MNLVNVSVQQAANTILADIFGVKYTVASKIDGQVNPIARSGAVDLFQSAFAREQCCDCGIYRIVPLDQALVGAMIQTASVPTAVARLGSSLQVVQLKDVSASEMRCILEPISPLGAILRADGARTSASLKSPGVIVMYLEAYQRRCGSSSLFALIIFHTHLTIRLSHASQCNSEW